MIDGFRTMQTKMQEGTHMYRDSVREHTQRKRVSLPVSGASGETGKSRFHQRFLNFRGGCLWGGKSG